MAEVILFNKPYGVLCHFGPAVTGDPAPRADDTAQSLKDFLPQRDVYPAGRLDADSEGLVVLTADGALQHRIADPKHKLPKVYYAEVEGVPTAESLDRLRAGVQLSDVKTRPAGAEWVSAPDWLWARVPPVRFRRHIPTAWVQITVVEGKNRQVRRMTAAVGLPTLRLIRYSVGDWTLNGLASGTWTAAPVPAPLAGAVTARPRSPAGAVTARPRSPAGAVTARPRSPAGAVTGKPRSRPAGPASSRHRPLSARARVSTGRGRRR